jgi:DNA-binding response OmpR family regulator
MRGQDRKAMNTVNARFIVYVEENDPQFIEVVELILKRTLDRRGFRMLIAKSNAEGIDLIWRLRPSLVLLGVATDSRTDVESNEVLQELKGDDELCHIPVIVMVDRRQSIGAVLGDVMTVEDPYRADNVLITWGSQELVASVNKVLEGRTTSHST